MTAPGPGREIVLVDCPDEVGLIHRITGVLQALRLNIDTNHEYVDAAQGWFFFRAEVTPAAGPVAAADLERFLIDSFGLRPERSVVVGNGVDEAFFA